MKKLARVLKGKKKLVFIDFEGTQHSHEMIAFAAIKVDIDENLTFKKVYKGLFRYVRATQPIGSYVTKLTQINEEMLANSGIPYDKAIMLIRQYVDKDFDKTMFIHYGNHDVRILNQSFVHSPLVDKKTQSLLIRQTFDFSIFLSEFMRDEKGNPLSLINALSRFGVTFDGQHHHALDDAKNLLTLFKKVMEEKTFLIHAYQKVLANPKPLAPPLQIILKRLLNNETVTPEMLHAEIEKYVA